MGVLINVTCVKAFGCLCKTVCGTSPSPPKLKLELLEVQMVC